MKRPDNITSADWQLLQGKYKNLEPIVKKIDSGYPVQYLIGNVDFYGYIIKVNPNVLIPRYETEALVEKILKYINKMGLENVSLLDIGTGSGCISVALKKEIESLEVTALDISSKAISLAKKNAKLNKVKINFIKKDLFKYDLVNNYDVIVSNPPYISFGDDVDVKIQYEPVNAIFVDGEPLKYYEQIFKIAKTAINKKHLIALEIDEDQGSNMKKLAKKYFPKDKIILEKDLADKDRYLFVISD